MEIWAGKLTRLGMAPIAAALIESLGMLKTVFAQLLYLGQPLLDGWLPDESVETLANLLEDEEQSAAFSALLREGKG